MGVVVVVVVVPVAVVLETVLLETIDADVVPAAGTRSVEVTVDVLQHCWATSYQKNTAVDRTVVAVVVVVREEEAGCG